MSEYSTRQVSAIVGLPDRRVRHWARVGVLAAKRSAAGYYRYSFQDIVTLRAVRELLAGRVTSRRVGRVIRALSRQLPPGRAASSVHLLAEGARVVARDAESTWEPENGQTLLEFDAQPRGGDVSSLSTRGAIASARAGEAAVWFRRGLEAETEGRTADAEAAYAAACEADSGHCEARINLGRLHHSAGRLRDAHELYREALAITPGDAMAWFNLGVVLEDGGDLRNALASYLRALEHSPDLPDAHYNAARLYQQRGDLGAAGHHYLQFKRLTRGRDT